MNEHAHTHHAQSAVQRGHEPNELNVAAVFKVGGGLLVIVVLVLVAMVVMFRVLASRGQAPTPLSASLGQVRQQPVEPDLNPGKRRQLEQLREAEHSQLGGYEWIDEKAGIARIPIERAIDILAEGSLPARQPGRAETKQTN